MMKIEKYSDIISSVEINILVGIKFDFVIVIRVIG